MVTTHPKNRNRANAVRDTWGKRCDVLYFVSSESDPSYPIIEMRCESEDHNHLWCKNRNGIIYGVNTYFDQFDWFYKADDDTYAIMENLRYMVSGYDHNNPLIFCLPFVYEGIQYPSGGPGYVFSKEAIKRLVDKLTDQNTDRKHCHTQAQAGADDLEIGRCLEGLGVEFVDTRDVLARGRFIPFQPVHFINPNIDIYKDAAWLQNYSIYKLQQGHQCCSDTVVSFHYINAADQYVLDYFVYHVKVKTNY